MDIRRTLFLSCAGVALSGALGPIAHAESTATRVDRTLATDAAAIREAVRASAREADAEDARAIPAATVPRGTPINPDRPMSRLAALAGFALRIGCSFTSQCSETQTNAPCLAKGPAASSVGGCGPSRASPTPD